MSIGEWLGYAYLGGCALAFLYFIASAVYEYFFMSEPRDRKFGYSLTCPLHWIVVAIACIPVLNAVMLIIWAIAVAYRYVADYLDNNQ